MSLDSLYFVEFVIVNGLAAIHSSDAPYLVDKVIYFQRTDWTYFSLAWTSIFFVKFSFLTFFSGLCDRLRKMELYRKLIYGLCVLIFIYCVLSGFVACPYLGVDECEWPIWIFMYINPSQFNAQLVRARKVAFVTVLQLLYWMCLQISPSLSFR